MQVRKICILGFDDYSMLCGDNSAGHIGGESVQHVLLARAWRDLGLDVSVIVYDHGQARSIDVDGVRAIASYAAHRGIPMLRFFHPRLTGVIGAMREADADVYYQSPSSAYTGVAAWFAARHRRQCIVRIASDLGCIPGKQLMRYSRDRKLYEYGLRNASMIAAQTEHQRRLLEQHYGLDSQIVNMIVEPAEATPPELKDIDVLWVGNLRPVKRPELFLELARRLPHRSFTMAGGSLPAQQAYFREMQRNAASLPNLRFLGAVSYSQTGELFARARLHVNTSSAEGFPNTFLQSWIRSVPVVSFFDPDGLIEQRRYGRRVADLNEMARAVDELLLDTRQRTAMGAAARLFTVKEFSPERVARRYLELVQANFTPVSMPDSAERNSFASRSGM